MAIEDWDVSLGHKTASNGAFTVTFDDTANGGISLQVNGGRQELTERECFEILMEVMNAIHDRKFAD